MGYETKLILINLSKKHVDEQIEKQRKDPKTLLPMAFHAQEVGAISLCKMGSGNAFSDLEETLPNKHTDPFLVTVSLYESNGDDTYEEDRYERPLYALPAIAVLQALQTYQRTEGIPYRRAEMAVALLKEFIIGFGDDAHVVLFGY